MIVQLSSRRSGQDEYVICPSASTTVPQLRERMLTRAKVTEGSYAYQLVDDLYAAIFVRSLDLKSDFHRFFEQEYNTFAEYLRRRLRFPPPAVAQLTDANVDSMGVYHFRPTLTFLDEDYGVEFLQRLLSDVPVEES